MMKNFVIAIIVLSGFIFSGTSCNSTDHKKENVRIKIAISKAIPEKRFKRYINWLRNVDSTVQYVDMYGLGIDSALKILETCDGLLITGGEDINPERYGEKFDSTRCDIPDNYRDTLDFALIGKALKLHLPIQGICRGHQMLNTYFGGTLYQDIPADIGTKVPHRHPPYKTARHKITIAANSLLNDITGRDTGTVNSNHHQGVKDLAPGLKATAFTDDGLPEAVELIDTNGKAYLLGVQWHPEAMDYNDPLSVNIARRFIDEAKKHALHGI